MNIQINQELSVETDIPFKTIHTFYMRWEINDHAELQMSGILNADIAAKSVSDKIVKLTLNEEILFSGIIVEEKRTYSGLTMVTIKAVSASIQLDLKKQSQAYQDVEQIYSQIARERIEAFDGNMLCTVGKQKIGKPVICYQETDWEFIKRLASRQNSFIIPDVKTGEPNIWYGMKQGNGITDNLQKEKITIEVEKGYDKSGEEARVKKYHVECSRNYSLGDSSNLYGEVCVVYKKQIWFENGACRFLYSLSNQIEVEELYNEAFTGLGLTGTIEDTENESVCISFDIGGGSRAYYYPWRPETGNALYEVPETGTKVVVYFRNHDERDGVAVRCVKSSKGNWNSGDKVNQTLADVYVNLKDNEIAIKKKKDVFTITDSKISINGGEVHIDGSGKVKVEAKKISLEASVEIKVTAE